MVEVLKEEIERNKAIATDYKAYRRGEVKMVDLVAKYRISATRIKQIGTKEKYQ